MVAVDEDRRSQYSAPALEKGLDILELLAGEGEGLSQKQIAERLGRSIGEIFRMLIALERRGYVRRRAEDGTYVLTLRLFELAHRHPPVNRLLQEAVAEMRRLSAETGQSCHLSIYDEDRIVVVARMESPQPRAFLVKLGADFPLADTSAGRVLMAFQSPEERARRVARALAGEAGTWTAESLAARLDELAERGIAQSRSDSVHGIMDLCAPVLDHHRHAVAALTLPFLEMVGNPVDRPFAAEALLRSTQRISARLGWSEE